MSSNMTLSASEIFEKIKCHQQDIDDNFEQPSMIIPNLRAHQRRAVKWMIERENNNEVVKSDSLPFSGGILADETGLGKTLEMLCCIIVNTSSSEISGKNIMLKNFKNDTQNPSIPVSLKPSTSNYESVLSEMSTVPKTSVIENASDEDSSIVECSCIIKVPITSTLVCSVCGKIQHAECVHFKPLPIQKMPYLCANCWTLNDIIQCKATLIVVPQSNLDQWILEISMHIVKPGLKVFVYKGMHFDGLIQPIMFNDYDVVLISYESLSKDLNLHYGLNNRTTSCLRNPNKYDYPQSPLSFIKWWRICFDHCQATESKITKVTRILSCLESVHKWVITGTPIHKSVNDLHSILKYLDIYPYYDHKQFLGFINNDTCLVYKCLSKVIWRSSVKDANSELDLPKLTFEKHWLMFSENEKYFYQNQHNYYAAIFSNTVTRFFKTFDISLKNINKERKKCIIEPLNKIRHACVHPQAINQKSLKVKDFMTMDKITNEMFEKFHCECNSSLKSYVSDLIHLARRYLVISEPATAVKHYRNALDLMYLYKDMKFQTFKYMKFHILYQLSNILAEHTELSDVLSDLDFKNNLEQLEKLCLERSKQKIESTVQIVQLYSDKVAKLANERKLGYSNWWSDVLKQILSPRDFIIKVQLKLENHRVLSDPNIADGLTSANDIFNILNVWLADLNSARIDTISILKTLGETPMSDLVTSGKVCHSPCNGVNNIDSKNWWCLICKASSLLQMYESLLFCVPDQQTNIPIDEIEGKEDVTSHKITNKGPWKISQKEFLLMELFQFGPAKINDNNFFKGATDHMKFFSVLREEFTYLWQLWINLNDNLSAHYKIVRAKELQKSQYSWPKSSLLSFDIVRLIQKRRRFETDHISKEDANIYIENLVSRLPLLKERLEVEISRLLYWEKLKNENNLTESEPCPICTFNMDSGWAVLSCGHNLCFKCIVEIASRNFYEKMISCPICRHYSSLNQIYHAKKNLEDEVPSIIIKGSFSTKIKSVTIKLMELIAQDPTVKVVIFSTLDYALKVLGKALEQNSVEYRQLCSKKDYSQTVLLDFKTNTKVNALLMNLSLSSKEFNFTEATRIFFMEPVINKVYEDVAIGQIYKIGQTKPTFVHHFILRESIEENITNMFYSDQLNKWDDITLNEMMTVFKYNPTNPLIPIDDNSLDT